MTTYSAFQSNAFQSNAFQIARVASSVADEDTHDLRTYRRYRKRLERASRAAEEYNKSKYIKEAVKAAAVARDIEVSTPVLEHIATSIIHSQPMPSLDFRAINAEIALVVQKLDRVIAAQEDEEETIILMSIL